MTYPTRLKKIILTCIYTLGLLGVLAPTSSCHAANSQPNVIVILVDDLNDWVGCLEGHPQANTPNIDALARRGVLFRNAHVQATFCGPSRVSLLSGKMPHNTGCYGFEPYESLANLQSHAPFPLHFRSNGYETFGGGKIFHHGAGGGWVANCWSHVYPTLPNPTPQKSMHWDKKVWDWGAYPNRDDEMGDYQLALAATKTLSEQHSAPFLMVLGFRRPHVPLHVPQKWFDRHPLKQVQPSVAPTDDLDDVPHPEVGLTPHAAPRHSDLIERNLLTSLTQAYLASISFVDHCVGTVLQGLDAGPSRNNTFVILLSDHGFHLGEKQHWAKRTLWEETTRIPLIVIGPGVPPNRTIDAPVSAIDLYPTLCELTQTKRPSGLEGESFTSLLANAENHVRRPAITTLGPGQYSVRSERYRYIRYEDGSEELYDHQNDGNEWRNLAVNPTLEHRAIMESHRKWVASLP